MGTLNVLQSCLDEGVDRLIHTSTSETYGTAQYTPIDERHPLAAQSPYAATKIGADKLAESYFLSFDLPVTTIRPFNTFGPRQSSRAVIPTIISQIMNGTEIISLGALAPVRDFIYVKDTVMGYLALAVSEDSVGQTVNIGRGDGIAIGELATLIIDLCESNARVELDTRRLRPEKSEILELVCDNRKARKTLAWEPKYSLEKGLEETIDWIRNNLFRYKSNHYNI